MLSSFGGVRAVAGGFRVETLRSHDAGHDGHHCRQSLGAIAIHTTRTAFFGKTGATQTSPFVWTPEKAPKGPVSIIVSGEDRAAYIYRNGSRSGVPQSVGSNDCLARTFILLSARWMRKGGATGFPLLVPTAVRQI
jgi:hypothetical protein